MFRKKQAADRVRVKQPSSQIHLKEIHNNPKPYEAKVPLAVTISSQQQKSLTTPNRNVFDPNINQSSQNPQMFSTLSKDQAGSMQNTNQRDELDMDALTTNIADTLHFNHKSVANVTQQHTMSGSHASISPAYANISKALSDKLITHPQYNCVPFFLSQNTVLPSANIHFNPSMVVPLPLKLYDSTNQSTWNTITNALSKLKQSLNPNISQDLPNLICSTIKCFRPDAGQQSNFQMLNRADLRSTLISILPGIIDIALRLNVMLEKQLPILAQGDSKTIFLTRELCCSLLANAFFCTFPDHIIGGMPDFNFFRLFNDTQNQRCEVKREKIKCILNYFRQMNITKDNHKFPQQIVSFERRCVPNRVDWARDVNQLCDVVVETTRKIEQAKGMLQVDFANKVVGGGVLNDGSVMEEIRFCISPELLVSRLFTQTLNDDEVLVVTGTEIYSEYSGYSTTFEFKGEATIDWGSQPTDNLGRTYTQVVAMDACSFKRNELSSQFQPHFIDRELHKANVAFMHGKAPVTPVATGNWGCGAFNGNPELKFFLQWIAASHQQRPQILYHTIGDVNQTKEIQEISMLLKKHNVGDVYKMIVQFSKDAGYQNGSLFGYVKKCITGGRSNKR